MSVERIGSKSFLFVVCSVVIVCDCANDKKLQLRQQHSLDLAQESSAGQHSGNKLGHTVGVFDSRGLQHLRKESNVTATVHAVDVAAFNESLPNHSVNLMKKDIEGRSYLTLVLIACVVLTLFASGFVSLQSYCRPRKDKPWHAQPIR
mmetsp:Transcript_18782/g.30454  ORF Transcript_18782/g.30454 Transcript_18782/m.30454 type:complete len:148 (-) Transcript_18782:29-472(-)